jgi:hypothetical protein
LILLFPVIILKYITECFAAIFLNNLDIAAWNINRMVV